MSPAIPRPRAGRPVTAPAYYLGRPASVWMAVARRRAGLDRIGAADETSAERAA